MCELLVIAADKKNADPYLDAKCYKAGDVVSVCPDGHPWGSAELENPVFRILKLPGVPVSAAVSFTNSEVDTDPNQPSHVLQRRVHRLDLTGLPVFAQKLMAANSRSSPTMYVPMTLQKLAALQVRKQPLADPNVFT